MFVDPRENPPVKKWSADPRNGLRRINMVVYILYMVYMSADRNGLRRRKSSHSEWLKMGRLNNCVMVLYSITGIHGTIDMVVVLYMAVPWWV